MDIALYGGSFNPAHVGHHLVAALVLATQPVDELWFVPTYKHMLGKELLDFEHRLEMCRLMARDLPRTSVCRAEQRLAKQPGFVGSRTIDLVKYVQEEWPNDRFRLILGSDLVDSFTTWEGWAEIVEIAPPIVVRRDGYDLPALAAHAVVPDISSTMVKKRIVDGEDFRQLVHQDVADYIVKHGLYDVFGRGQLMRTLMPQ